MSRYPAYIVCIRFQFSYTVCNVLYQLIYQALYMTRLGAVLRREYNLLLFYMSVLSYLEYNNVEIHRKFRQTNNEVWKFISGLNQLAAIMWDPQIAEETNNLWHQIIQILMLVVNDFTVDKNNTDQIGWY